MLENQNKWKQKSRSDQQEADNEKVKNDHKKWKAKSRLDQREGDNEKVKDDQNRWKRLSRNKRKLADPKGLSEYEKEVQKKRRRLWRAQDRLREFKEATKYNAIFICSCCHRRLFHSNLEIITQKLIDKINDRTHGHSRDCMEIDIETPINGMKDCYICKTYAKHALNHI